MKLTVHGVELTGRDLLHVLVGAVLGVTGVYVALIAWLGSL